MNSAYYKFYKPLFDFVIAVLALIILMPLLCVIGLVIVIESKGPIFFTQERIGKAGQVFKIIKFRTMLVGEMNYENDFKNYANNPRITKFGRILRSTSIDEIPQLINIIKGEMSFIGPRPPLIDYPKKISEYDSIEKTRFNVRPGMSGLVQVRNRHCDDWSINIPIDVEYVQTLNFKSDVMLFFRSFLSFFQ